MKRTLVLALAAAFWRPGPIAADTLADRAAAVLDRHCAPCHGGPGVSASANQGGFDSVRDPDRMVDAGLLVRFHADQSELYQRIRDGEMPPEQVDNRPDKADLEVLRQWIAAGAPARVAGTYALDQRPFITPSAVDRAISQDLGRHHEGTRARLRYISLAHLHNAGLSDQELDLVRDAVTKLLGSLTWSRSIIRPMAIDGARTLYRIDLRALGWSREQWDRLAARDPYAIARTTRDAVQARKSTRSIVPLVRADWLVHAASRPPLYHDLLGIPRHVRDLERRVGIDAARNVRDHRVMRAGFNGSGVSRHNRVVERHALAGGGYYWQSYDFQGSAGHRNIFDFPTEFRHDGGEIIVSLPNGFQAYMLADRAGRRIDKAPTDVVTDPSRGDGAVTSGVSCMGCHTRGIIDKNDEIRRHVIASREAFDRRSPALARRALALYPGRDALDAAYARDRARFEQAIARAGITSRVEPINATAQRFEAELTATRAAAELGLTPDDLAARLARRPALSRKLGSVLVAGGTVKRDVFESVFAEAAYGLGLGPAVSSLPAAHRQALACDTGLARACLQAGRAFYRGVGVHADPIRASQLFASACSDLAGEGCRALGHLHYRGHGVDRDPARARTFYEMACNLGSAGGCGNAAFIYHTHGSGIRRTRPDPVQAARLYARACNLGRPSSCFVLGEMFHDGTEIARDHARAARVFEAACNRDYAPACGRLGQQYRWGKGVRLDWLRSYQLFERACDLGHRQSCADILDVRALLGVQ